MRTPRWHLRSLMVAVAALAVLTGGAVKWRRTSLLHARIAAYAREETRLREEYERLSRRLTWCGNERRYANACAAVAAERRRQRLDCERELRRLW